MGLKCVAFLLLLGCQPALERQPKMKDFAASEFFADHSSARTPVAGTMPFAKIAENPRQPMTKALLLAGRKYYDIHCSPCHGWGGSGDGMVVQRGLPVPVSFHNPSLRQRTAMDLFEFMATSKTHRPSLPSRLSESERWAVAGYLKALQLSEHFPAVSLNRQDLVHLEGGEP